MVYQEIINSIESLSIDEQDELFELIRRRRIEQWRAEIADNARQTMAAVEKGTAKSFNNFEDLKSYLLADDE
jgi:dGTP triphosphohydrolase